MNESPPVPSRKARFKAALALAEQTAQSWCEREGIGYPHLVLVLNGDRESQRLLEKVDAFIEQYLPSISTPAA